MDIYSQEYRYRLDALIGYCCRTMFYLGQGRHRIVFTRDHRYVIKIPLNDGGFEDNWQEDASYRGRHPNKNQLARCRMWKLNDIPVLIMEYVQMPSVDAAALPDWVDFYDCGQVGFNRSGELKAYDYGML